MAYWFSLRSLLGDWNYQTPLGDTVLVPLLAIGLGIAAARRHPYFRFVRLGRFDFGLGLALLTGALVLLAAGPVVWSKYFWAARVDLLALPLVAAAGVLLLFGVRALVPFLYPIAFLLLAWPLPYLALLDGLLNTFTTTTAAAVGAVASATRLASSIPGTGGTAFALSQGGNRFSVAIGSACSGVDGLVGYLLVAAFAAYFVRGSALRRVGLFLAGLALVWSFNVLRILLILVAGRLAGEPAAFAVLHPIAGLLALNAALLVLVRVGSRIGLRWSAFAPARDDTPLAQPAPPHQQATPRAMVGRVGLLVVVSALLAIADGQLATAAQGYTNDGRPAVRTFVERPTVGPGWRVSRIEKIGWAAQYYGPHSTWVRYRLRPVRASHPSFTAWLDAVQSPDLGSLDAYSLAHCFGFHHFQVDLDRRVELGHGVVGQAFVYNTDRGLWHVVSWQWPVLGRHHTVTHERIALIASSSIAPKTAAPPTAGGIQGFVLSLLDLPARSQDDNPVLTRALTNLAAHAVAARIGDKR
jgi:exosortase/archaeosortase family protein